MNRPTSSNRSASSARRSLQPALRVAMGLVAAMASLLASPAAHAQEGGVSLTITLDAASSEVIGAWRRANGLDAPDAAADRRLAELVNHKQGRAAARPGTVLVRAPLADPRPPQLRLLASAAN